ncbi:MAG: gliding motility-associated C-terminal domain-containing protein, partial [Saprospiraceae bacterium]
MKQIPVLILFRFSFVLLFSTLAWNAFAGPADTLVCPGNPVSLLADGGDIYLWSPATGLSCTDCPNPTATVSENTVYAVQIIRNGDTTVQTFAINVYGINLGPDLSVCNNAVITLNPGGVDYPDATYAWQGFPPNFSCTDCPSPQLTGLTTGIYFYFGFLNAPGCSFTDTLKISVFNGQQPTYNIASDTILCTGNSLNIGGAGVPNTFYTWTSIPAGFTSNQPNPTVTPQEPTTYLLTVAGSTCPFSVFDSVRVGLVPNIVLNLQKDTLVCQGQPVRLNYSAAQDGVAYAWTPNDGHISDTTLVNPVARPETTTTYKVTATNAGCTAIDSVEIAISPINIELSVDTAFLCLGGEAQVNVVTLTPANAQVTWSPLFNISIGAGGLTVSLNPDESALYTASIATPGCTRSASVWVQVDSLPADLSVLPADTTICQGSLVLLTSKVFEPASFPGIVFEWTPLAGQESADSLYNLVVKPSDTTEYQRITTIGACIDTALATVNVIPTANMNITPQGAIVCPGDTIRLNLTYDPGVTNIMWMPENGLSCSTCDNPLATILNTTFYTVTGESSGCPVSAGVVVQTHPLPGYAFPNDRKLCLGDTLRLNTVNDPNTTYSWTSTVPGFGVQTSPTPIWIPTQANATFFLDAVTVNDCRVLDTFSVTYSSSTMEAFGDTTICRGATAKLTAIASQPGTFTWNDGQTGSTVLVSPIGTTTYTVEYKYAGDCFLYDLVTVSVQGSGPAVTFPPDRQLCPGESTPLNSTPVLGATYTWTSQPAGFSSNLPSPTVSPTVTTTYFVTAVQGVCTETGSVTIVPASATVNAKPDTAICAGDELMLSASVAGTTGGSFSWSPGGKPGASITVMPDTSTTYIVTYNYGDGCKAFDSVEVVVNPGFDLSINSTPNTDTLSLGQELDLMAVVKPSQNTSNFEFTWTEVLPNMEVIGTGEMITYIPSINQDSMIKLTLIAVSPNGCEQRVSLDLLIVLPVVKFPNVFSPNDDTFNDTFKPAVIIGAIFIEQMDIYSRWGQKVFTSTDVKAEWNGEADGKPAPADVYIYNIRYRRGDGSLQVAH